MDGDWTMKYLVSIIPECDGTDGEEYEQCSGTHYVIDEKDKWKVINFVKVLDILVSEPIKQSLHGQAPPLHQKGEVAKAETCITCIKHKTPQCQYKDEDREVEGCSFHRSEQSHLQGEVGGQQGD